MDTIHAPGKISFSVQCTSAQSFRVQKTDICDELLGFQHLTSVGVFVAVNCHKTFTSTGAILEGRSYRSWTDRLKLIEPDSERGENSPPVHSVSQKLNE